MKNGVYLHPQLEIIRLLWSVRLGVRTHGFHPCNTGSIPVRTTKFSLKTNKLRIMANHKSALKRIRSNDAKRLRNKYQHKTTRNALRDIRATRRQKRS